MYNINRALCIYLSMDYLGIWGSVF